MHVVYEDTNLKMKPTQGAHSWKREKWSCIPEGATPNPPYFWMFHLPDSAWVEFSSYRIWKHCIWNHKKKEATEWYRKENIFLRAWLNCSPFLLKIWIMQTLPSSPGCLVGNSPGTLGPSCSLGQLQCLCISEMHLIREASLTSSVHINLISWFTFNLHFN